MQEKQLIAHRRNMKDDKKIADSSQGKLESNHFHVLKKLSGSILACFRIALSVPSGISPE
jgi:hypothetical protein